jgi:N-glycosylase/DNA lyase
MKEASHFLRNIGERNLAILDRHIFKHLKRLGVIKEIPRSVTKRRYLEIEKKWHKYANKIGILLDELDLLFWSMETGEIRK